METEKFSLLVEARVRKINRVLFRKASQYATEDDRLFNFKAGAEAGGDGESPTQTLLGYMKKQWVEYTQIMNTKESSLEREEEVLLDLHAYLMLAEGLLVERRSEANAKEDRGFAQSVGGVGLLSGMPIDDRSKIGKMSEVQDECLQVSSSQERPGSPSVKFKPGDVVRLTSSDVRMTIRDKDKESSVSDPVFRCQWFDGQNICFNGSFPASSLVKASFPK